MSLTIFFKCPCCNRGDAPNITHNLKPMAIEAGLGGLWEIVAGDPLTTRPSYWIPRLEIAVYLMKSFPERFEKHNSPNGWGRFENFLPWVEALLERCRESPSDSLRIHR